MNSSSKLIYIATFLPSLVFIVAGFMFNYKVGLTFLFFGMASSISGFISGRQYVMDLYDSWQNDVKYKENDLNR